MNKRVRCSIHSQVIGCALSGCHRQYFKLFDDRCEYRSMFSAVLNGPETPVGGEMVPTFTNPFHKIKYILYLIYNTSCSCVSAHRCT